jgi:hypothetical protein
MVDIFLVAAKRRAAEAKPAVKKAGVLPTDILFKLHEKYYLTNLENAATIDPVMLRTFVRAVIVYFTFCRYNCYNKLRAMDLEDNGNSITVTFTSAKNDQFHNGQSSCLIANSLAVDPVSIVRKYYQLCGFKFGKIHGDTSYLNCVMRKKKNSWFADGRRTIGYTTGVKDIRNMLTGVGIAADRATDKSFKMLGVTHTLEAGTALEDVMHHGRWRTVSMPLHYKVNSLQFKESVASKVPT